MENILTIENISKYYGNKSNLTKAISNISMNVDKGEFIAIMGKIIAKHSHAGTYITCLTLSQAAWPAFFQNQSQNGEVQALPGSRAGNGDGAGPGRFAGKGA